MKQQTNNKWRNAFIATLIIVIVMVWVFLIIDYSSNQYQKGISDGVNQTIQEIAYEQATSGNILLTKYIMNEQNENWSGNWKIYTMPITEICQNILDAQQGANNG